MTAISPSMAAELAKEVYRVREAIELKLFLASKIFTPDPKSKTMLKAEVGARIINVKDGFAVCARGGKGYENDLFLMFRGTSRAADFISDARIGVERSVTGMPVHIGFNHVFTTLLPQLRAFVAANLNGITQIHCIGHSLGGAVATLAADWVSMSTKLKVNLYTFGSPRVGFEFFSTAVTRKLTAANIYRVYHETDPVSMVPVYPYSHLPMPGHGYFFPSSQSILTAKAHFMAAYINSVEGHTWETLKLPPPLASGEQAIKRWLASGTPVNPLNPQTWVFIDAGLNWVVQSVMTEVVITVQFGFMSFFTLADKISWMLIKGIELAKETSVWVLRLMRKIMQALGMKAVDSVEQLTRAFMRLILERLLRRITEEAAKAVRSIKS